VGNSGTQEDDFELKDEEQALLRSRAVTKPKGHTKAENWERDGLCGQYQHGLQGQHTRSSVCI
jgi:hypothetical protein